MGIQQLCNSRCYTTDYSFVDLQFIGAPTYRLQFSIYTVYRSPYLQTTVQWIYSLQEPLPTDYRLVYIRFIGAPTYRASFLFQLLATQWSITRKFMAKHAHFEDVLKEQCHKFLGLGILKDSVGCLFNICERNIQILVRLAK